LKQELINIRKTKPRKHAPKPDENPSGMRGNKDEAMKITSNYINLYES